MDAQFWHEKWEKNEIGFHQGRANPLLASHVGALNLAEDARVFLPLCGKAQDIPWLLDRGYRVAGAELSEIAVGQLFDGMGVTPEITPVGALRCYSGPGVDVFAGDVFDLSQDMLGPVDAVYDRAALVALPAETRGRYADHIRALTGAARQLVITFTYDQSVMPGPPFAVPEDEVMALFAASYTVEALETVPVEGRLKGIAEADEIIWLME